MKVFLNDRESFDSLLRRFKRKAERAGIVTDYRKKDFYEKPTAVKRRKKDATLRKVKLKNQRDLEMGLGGTRRGAAHSGKKKRQKV